CPKGRGQTQLSPQKDTRLPNPSRDFLQRQKSARCTSLLNGRPQSEKDSQEIVQHLVRKHFMPSPADAAVPVSSAQRSESLEPD
ncbi:MAG: hypothetical protein WBW73_19900, partial [Rhodoplanes sp.]